MPNSKLDKKKLDFYRKKLLEVKEKIVSQIKHLSDDSSSLKDKSGDISGHALHMADVATDMYDREFSLGLASNDRELLHRVDAALGRISDKTYGICVSCSKSIPEVRLKALLYVDTCLKCQEELESKK